jgi:hypothetical protein
MSKCKYCGEDSGFLSNYHNFCQEKYNEGLQKINGILKTAIFGYTDFSSARREIESIKIGSFIGDGNLRDVITQALLDGVEEALSDHLLTQEEEEILLSYMRYFNIDRDQTQTNDAYTKIVKAAILREVFEGKIPSRVKVEGHLPIVFEKNESIIWIIKNVNYLTQKTSTHIEGKYQGVSIRVVKGLYYRLGKSKGYPVSTTETIDEGQGLLIITNKNLFFVGVNRPVKIPYRKILSIHPFDDGIGIELDAKNSKPQFIKLDDVWYGYNLIYNLANLKL